MIMKRILVYFLFTIFFHTLQAQSMEWLCRPGTFVDIQYLGHDLFKVKNESGKCGVVSAEGKEVLAVKYDSITTFVENYALVLDKSGAEIIAILNTQGKDILSRSKTIYTTAYPYFKEGLLSFKDSKGLCGYLNTNGKISIEPKFYLAAPFQNGVATVQYEDGYYGLINKSGGSAIISDVKYNFMSSVVDGFVFVVTPKRRGGDLLRLMKLNGNKLEYVEDYESGLFVDLSDDFTYLFAQNGNEYFIDAQWRIYGTNFKSKLPYLIKDNNIFIVESSELLSKQESNSGVQITYLGKPILENSFNQVSTYEKKYAIVSGKDNKIGVLRLNPSAGIELFPPVKEIVFNHYPNFKNILEPPATLLEKYVEVNVDIKDVEPSQLKCYINENGHLWIAPLKQKNGGWNLYLPYFQSDTVYHNVISRTVDIAITYDGLDWMHRMVRLSSRHEPGYKITISGNDITNNKGVGEIIITVESVNGTPSKPVPVYIDCLGSKPIYLKGGKLVKRIPIKINKDGERKTFEYKVKIVEPGCPAYVKVVSKEVIYPKLKEEIQEEFMPDII